MTDSLTDNFKSRDASASKNHTDITKTHLVPVTPDFAIHLPYLKGVKEMKNNFVSSEEASPPP